MASSRYGVIPEGAIEIEHVIELIPTVRQSLLAHFDDCGLSTFMEMKFSNGWSTHPQARGTIFHLFAAKCLRTMQAAGSKTIPVQLAEEILTEACRQETDSLGEPIPAAELVRVPLRQMGELRMAARKFARDNEFNVDRIVDIEKRLAAEIEYPGAHGGIVKRVLTGQIDALLYDAGTNGAVVLDWKDTWGLPPERRVVEGVHTGLPSNDDQMRQISYHGYFQQRFYGWLVLKNYPQVQQVTLREFYVRKTEARSATLTREWMHEVEAELSIAVQAFDQAVMQGAPSFPYGWFDLPEPVEVVQPDGEVKVVTRELDIGRLGRWQPSPGKHCGFCARPRACPIDEDTRIDAGAPPSTMEKAMKLAGERTVAQEAYQRITESLKAFVEEHGAPVPLKSSKGRYVVGWVKNKTGKGRTFKNHVPEDSDRGGDPALDKALDAKLADAMREATDRAQREKPARPRANRTPGKS